MEKENLFIENIYSIIKNKWNEKKHVGKGSFHWAKDFPKDFNVWESTIIEEI